MHSSEMAGLDITPSPEDGLWRAVTYGKGTMSEIIVDVGPVLHRGMSYLYLHASMKQFVSFRSLPWLRIF